MDGVFHKEASLINVGHFVSPEYKLNKYKKTRETFIPGENRLKRELDKDDLFPNWLRQNSFLFKFNQDNPGSEIYGRNGVYCRIINLEVLGQRMIGESDSGLVVTPYHRVVRVCSMPNDRTLPDELSRALRDNKYEFRSEESELVRKFCLKLGDEEKNMF